MQELRQATCRQLQPTSEQGKLLPSWQPLAGLDRFDGLKRQCRSLGQVWLAKPSLLTQVDKLDPDVNKRPPVSECTGATPGRLARIRLHPWRSLDIRPERSSSPTSLPRAVCYRPGMNEVETARLLLWPWQPDDLVEFTRLLTDPEVTRYIVVHTPFSP